MKRKFTFRLFSGVQQSRRLQLRCVQMRSDRSLGREVLPRPTLQGRIQSRLPQSAVRLASGLREMPPLGQHKLLRMPLRCQIQRNADAE